jgi:hypothetical protein
MFEVIVLVVIWVCCIVGLVTVVAVVLQPGHESLKPAADKETDPGDEMVNVPINVLSNLVARQDFCDVEFCSVCRDLTVIVYDPRDTGDGICSNCHSTV